MRVKAAWWKGRAAEQIQVENGLAGRRKTDIVGSGARCFLRECKDELHSWGKFRPHNGNLLEIKTVAKNHFRDQVICGTCHSHSHTKVYFPFG